MPGGIEQPRGVVIVTDGETRPALAAVRSLGAAGYGVHVVAARGSSLAGSSRFADAEHVLPDAEISPRAWSEALERLAASLPGSLVLPVTEIALGTIYETAILGTSGSDASASGRCAVAAPDRAAYSVAVDKYTLLRRGGEAGLDVPRTTLVEEPSALKSLPQGYEYPVVVKARRSRWLEGEAWRSGGTCIVRGDAELAHAAGDPGLEGGALIQEHLPGHGEGLFYLMEHGAVRVRFAHRRVREKPPWGGVSVVSESIAPDPELASASERLLGELAWHGVAMVEFRRTPDGRAMLMEVNPRLWGSLQLAIDAGVDFPRLLVALHRGEPVEPVEPRQNVRSRWLLGDLDHLAISLRRREARRARGRSVPGLVADFARSFFDGTRLDVWRRDDPGPFRVELRSRLGR